MLPNVVFAGETGEEFLGAVSREYGWPLFREVRVTRAPQPVELLRSLTGRYVFREQNWAVSVVYEANALTVVFPNGDRYALTPIRGAPRDFIHPASGVRVVFDGDGSDVRIQLYGQTGHREPSGR
jgi:hypothetical protein